MERMMRGRGHGVDVSIGSSPPRRAGWYSLARPKFEDHSHYADRLSEFNAGFSRGNPTSSKFEWKLLFGQSNALGSNIVTDNCGTNAAVTAISAGGVYSGGRFSNSSLFGTNSLLEEPVFMEPDRERNFSSCQLGNEVPRGCDIVKWDSFDRDFQMDEDSGLHKQAYSEHDASMNTKMGFPLKEFSVGHQKDALPSSFDDRLHDVLSQPGLSSGLVTTPTDYHGRLGMKSTGSHGDPPNVQTSNMRSNPIADFYSTEAKRGDCNFMENQKSIVGNMCEKLEKFYGNMGSTGEEYAGPDIVRASIGDHTVDRLEECYPGIYLKNTRMCNQVSSGKGHLISSYLPANGSLHPEGQERVLGYRSNILKYEEDEKHRRLLSAKDRELEGERPEKLTATGFDSCLDTVDGKFKRQLPAGDSRRNTLKRKDGVADVQGACEDPRQLAVSKKLRCSLPKDRNTGKPSSKTECHRFANSDNHLSGLDKSSGVDTIDINKSFGTSLQTKLEPLGAKRLRQSPQNTGATDSSVKKQKHSVVKHWGPTPKELELCPLVLQNLEAVKLTKKIRNDPESPNGAYDQEEDFLKTNIIPAKTELSCAPSPRLKNRKSTSRILGDPDEAQSKELDYSKSNSTPAKAGPHVPHSLVGNQTLGKLAKGIRDGPDGTCSEEGDSSNNIATPAKTEPPCGPPPQVTKQIPGKFTKTLPNGTDGTHSQEGDCLKVNAVPAKIKLPHSYVPPPHLKNDVPGEFCKRSRDVTHAAHNQEDNFLKGNAAASAKTEPPHVSAPQVKIQKPGNCTIQDSPDGPSSQEGNSWKGSAALAKTGCPNVCRAKAKKKKSGKFTRRPEDALDRCHGQAQEFSKVKTAKNPPLHVHSPGVKSQKSRKFNPAGSHEARSQKEDSSKVNVTHMNTDPPENSQEFEQRVHSVFLKFVKQLNESSARWRSFMEQGKAGSLKCYVCGSKSREFVDMESLALHTFISQTAGCRSLHLGFHKALCLMMGWKSAISFNSLWICEALPGAEASALKENFIIWPPVAIIHNNSVQNKNPDERATVTIEIFEAVLKEMGFGERTKVCHGRPGNQSIMVVKFQGTLSGLQDAERLHRLFAKTKRGRAEFQKFSNSNRSSWETNTSAFQVENFMHGYLGVAEDLDKLDFETKKRSFVRSKKEIQIIADAF